MNILSSTIDQDPDAHGAEVSGQVIQATWGRTWHWTSLAGGRTMDAGNRHRESNADTSGRVGKYSEFDVRRSHMLTSDVTAYDRRLVACIRQL